MATTPTIPGRVPAGFKSPFNRVAMTERIDDALACVATLTGQPLNEIKKLAVRFGFPEHGPGWIDPPMIQQLLAEFSLIASDYQTVKTISALPDVAILLADYNPDNDIGRHIVWHHVRGTADIAAFHYVIDVGNWVPAEFQITTDFSFVNLNPPLWYLGVSPKTGPTVKGKSTPLKGG